MPSGIELFERCLAAILREEGGLGELTGDPGKLTNRGITQATYDHYRSSRGMPQSSVAILSEYELRDIYYNEYWKRSLSELMNWPLCLAHFHFFVNSTPANSFKALQRALDVVVDGIVGKQTHAAIELANRTLGSITTTTYALLLEQVFIYDSLDENDPVKTRFLTELWLKRIKHIFRECKTPFNG